MKWAVGITTAPRKEPTIEECVDSVVNCGWKPYIFAEPDSPDLNCIYGINEIFINPIRMGVLFNWYRMCLFLLQHTDAEYIMTIQDDSYFHYNAKSFIENYGWPSEDCGFISLYTSSKYQYQYMLIDKNNIIHYKNIREQEVKNKQKLKKYKYCYIEKREIGERNSLIPLKIGCLWGACAWIFRRDILNRVLEHDMILNWKGWKRKLTDDSLPISKLQNLDYIIGQIMIKLNLKTYFAHPSYVKHIAKHSSIGHGHNSGGMNTKLFIGDI